MTAGVGGGNAAIGRRDPTGDIAIGIMDTAIIGGSGIAGDLRSELDR
jgi:hypothetical protein